MENAKTFQTICIAICWLQYDLATLFYNYLHIGNGNASNASTIKVKGQIVVLQSLPQKMSDDKEIGENCTFVFKKRCLKSRGARKRQQSSSEDGN